jgi:hypothetical protein
MKIQAASLEEAKSISALPILDGICELKFPARNRQKALRYLNYDIML